MKKIKKLFVPTFAIGIVLILTFLLTACISSYITLNRFSYVASDIESAQNFSFVATLQERVLLNFNEADRLMPETEKWQYITSEITYNRVYGVLNVTIKDTISGFIYENGIFVELENPIYSYVTCGYILMHRLAPFYAIFAKPNAYAIHESGGRNWFGREILTYRTFYVHEYESRYILPFRNSYAASGEGEGLVLYWEHIVSVYALAASITSSGGGVTEIEVFGETFSAHLQTQNNLFGGLQSTWQGVTTRAFVFIAQVQ